MRNTILILLLIATGCTVDRQCTATGDPDADFSKGVALLSSNCKIQCNNGLGSTSKSIETDGGGFTYRCDCRDGKQFDL